MFKKIILCGIALLSMQTAYAQSSFTHTPVTLPNVIDLLDDGSSVSLGRTEWGPTPACPSPPPRMGCPPPQQTAQYLNIQSAFSPPVELPFKLERHVSNLLHNQLGHTLAWENSSLMLIDMRNNTSIEVASDLTEAQQQCIKSSTILLSNRTNGDLAIQNPSQCGINQNLHVLVNGQFKTAAPPKDYAQVNVIGLNRHQQIIVNAPPLENKPLVGLAGFVWSNGQYKKLNVPFLNILVGYTRTQASAINDHGTVAGDISGPKMYANGQAKAVIWENGTGKEIGSLPGYKYSKSLAINNQGTVLACAYNDQIHNGVAFIRFKNGQKKALDLISQASDSQSNLPTHTCPRVSAQNLGGQWILEYASREGRVGGKFLVSPN